MIRRPRRSTLTYTLFPCTALFRSDQFHTATSACACLSATAFFLFGIHGPIAKVARYVAPKLQRAAFVGTYLTIVHFSSAATPAVIGFLISTSGTLDRKSVV